MPNMSHCRFSNTAGDLVDCHEVIESMLTGELTTPLSDRELRAAKELVQTCCDILNVIAHAASIDPDDQDEFTNLQRGAARILDSANAKIGGTDA